jgi:hypothetical protein
MVSADIDVWSFPRKQTFADTTAMSVKCQDTTFLRSIDTVRSRITKILTPVSVFPAVFLL